MQQEHLIHVKEKNLQSLADTDFLVIASIMLVGSITRMFRSVERVSFRVMLGEILLAFLISIFLFFVGLYENLSNLQIALIAIPASLGNMRLLQFLMNAIDAGKSLRSK